MKQKIIKQTFYWLSVIVVGIALGLALQFARAWTEPGEAPPGGNLAAPLNTSGNTQVKMGPLGVNSSGLGILPLQLGLDVGGKTQADDFCLRSDPTKCLSNISGANLSNLRVGPPGCNNILTFSATCYTQACGEYQTTAYVPAGEYSSFIAVPATMYFTCGGSCSAGSSKSCSTAPVGTGFLSGSDHSTDSCTAAGGVVMQDGSDSFCKFDRTSCPSGWTKFKNWTTTSPKTCNGTTNDNSNCPSNSSMTCSTGSHSFSDHSPESCSYLNSRTWTSYGYECGAWGICWQLVCDNWCDTYGFWYYLPYDCYIPATCSASYCADSWANCYAKTEDGIGCY